MSTCNCRICENYRRINKIIEERNTDELIKLVREQQEVIICAETDNEYYEAVLSGKWPDSRDILMEAIEKYDATDHS